MLVSERSDAVCLPTLDSETFCLVFAGNDDISIVAL
jgi:hypothetical protein